MFRIAKGGKWRAAGLLAGWLTLAGTGTAADKMPTGSETPPGRIIHVEPVVSPSGEKIFVVQPGSVSGEGNKAPTIVDPPKEILPAPNHIEGHVEGPGCADGGLSGYGSYAGGVRGGKGCKPALP